MKVTIEQVAHDLAMKYVQAQVKALDEKPTPKNIVRIYNALNDELLSELKKSDQPNVHHSE